MANQSVFIVGTPEEVEHHAAPLQKMREVHVVAPDKINAIAKPGDLAIFTMEHFDRFRDACIELKNRNVATLYMIDGILEWRNAWENRADEPACPFTMRPVLAHKVACIGPSQARILADWGNCPKIEVVGVPRFDGLKKGSTADANEPFRVLVMTAKCPGFTPRQVENTTRALRDLKAWCDQNPTTIDGRPIEIIWRLTQGLEEQIGVENRLQDLTGVELADTLSMVNAVVTTPSTAMLEAMLFELPVAILDYNNTPQYVQAAWHINSAEVIADIMTELNDPPSTKLMFQHSVLNDALSCDDLATTRLSKLIEQMLEIAAKKVAAGENLEFPERILTEADFGETANPSRFGHAELYPKFGEFRQHDLVELQVQLAHSRREINHLHGEMNQLQSELDEAHRIFDQINQHPIAGPIVKARQKLIDWLARFKTRKDTDVTSTPALMAPAELDSPSAETLKQG